jgi:hypothetical protein
VAGGEIEIVGRVVGNENISALQSYQQHDT